MSFKFIYLIFLSFYFLMMLFFLLIFIFLLQFVFITLNFYSHQSIVTANFNYKMFLLIIFRKVSLKIQSLMHVNFIFYLLLFVIFSIRTNSSIFVQIINYFHSQIMKTTLWVFTSFSFLDFTSFMSLVLITFNCHKLRLVLKIVIWVKIHCNHKIKTILVSTFSSLILFSIVPSCNRFIMYPSLIRCIQYHLFFYLFFQIFELIWLVICSLHHSTLCSQLHQCQVLINQLMLLSMCLCLLFWTYQLLRFVVFGSKLKSIALNSHIHPYHCNDPHKFVFLTDHETFMIVLFMSLKDKFLFKMLLNDNVWKQCI